MKTLHWYIGRELIRVTALALVAFTLVMTVLAIIEPLRKRGLAADQVLSLFIFTLPVMLSLTMPVAALFAATIVYGRFAQDNELLAARASGIATISLLKPALLLGVAVTVGSLTLNNFVSPRLARMGEEAVKANVRNLLYHEMAIQGHFRHGPHIIAADRIDPKTNTLLGFVYANAEAPKPPPAAPKGKSSATQPASRPVDHAPDVTMVTASRATVAFDKRGERTYATITLEDMTVSKSNQPWIAQESLQRPSYWIELPNPIREKPTFYDWGRLVGSLRDPTGHNEIRASLEEVRRRIIYDTFAREARDAIQNARPYARLADDQFVYVVTAAGAAVGDDQSCYLRSGEVNGTDVPVVVTKHRRLGSGGEARPGAIVERITGRQGIIRATWMPILDVSQASIEVTGDPTVTTTYINDAGQSRDMAAAEEWAVGQLPLPALDTTKVRGATLSQIYSDPTAFTSNAGILATWRNIQRFLVRRLMGEIAAEMHGRVAYGVSCMLLVSMGAALGLIFRGGQIISAFALSVLPAALVIVLILMGKEMVANPGVQESMGMWPGLIAIWSGIVAVTIADVGIYFWLSRR